MPAPLVSEEEFIRIWRRTGSPTAVAAETGVTIRNVLARRARIEASGTPLPAIKSARTFVKPHEGRVDLEIENGCVIVFSDAHFEPKVRTTAFRALLAMIRQLNPLAVICNGDAFDGGTISRHPRIGWDRKPSVMDELKAVSERLAEIEKAAGRAELIWCLGNHDARFESFLAANAPQYEHVHGFRLKDHFPAWRPAWATWVNQSTVIKHRNKNGIHATHNNTVTSGVTMVTGHLHQLKVTPWSDYTGRRYGVDTGTLADPYGSQFIDYTEAGPVNWHSGFAVLTWRDGVLLAPELVAKFDEDRVEFRGHLLDADTGKVCAAETA